MLCFLTLLTSAIERIISSNLSRVYKPVVVVEVKAGEVNEVVIHRPHYDVLDDVSLIRKTGIKPHLKIDTLMLSNLVGGLNLFSSRYAVTINNKKQCVIDMSTLNAETLIGSLLDIFSLSHAYIELATLLLNENSGTITISSSSVTVQVKTETHTFVCYARYKQNAHLASLSLMGDNNIMGIKSLLLPKCGEIVSISTIEHGVIHPTSIETNQSLSLTRYDSAKHIKQLLKRVNKSL